MTPRHSIVLFIAAFLILIFIPGCPDDNGVRPKDNPLHLSIDDVSCTDALLLIELSADEPQRNVTLHRDDSAVAVISMFQSDTLFFDDGLLPGKTYQYTVSLDQWSSTASATTLDTTSHEVQWMDPDTLGVYGYITDVWAFSKNDAWAVGEIRLPDSSGKPDVENPYNAAHWDGVKWELRQIETRDIGSGKGFYPLYAIFAFSPNDIFFSSDGELIHWDGIRYSSYAFFAPQLPFNGQVRKIWGINSRNLYCVGRTGSIYRYSGSGNWSKMESNTDVDLQDIWGIDESHIWATGTTVSNGHCVVLQYDGDRWRTIYDNANKPPNQFWGFMTLWTDTPNRLYIDGSGLHIINMNNLNFGEKINTERIFASIRLRGNTRNDIFNVGPVEVSHFNGYYWKRFSESNGVYNESARLSNVFPTKYFILMGGYFYTGINGIPIVIRGYR